MTALKVIDIAAWASVASMLLYALTGVALWAPLQAGDGGRFALLCAAHIAPIFVAVIRRSS